MPEFSFSRSLPAAREPFDLEATEQHGIIAELRASNWFTNSPDVGAQLFAALETKWGKPTIGKDGVHTWKPPGRDDDREALRSETTKSVACDHAPRLERRDR